MNMYLYVNMDSKVFKIIYTKIVPVTSVWDMSFQESDCPGNVCKPLSFFSRSRLLPLSILHLFFLSSMLSSHTWNAGISIWRHGDVSSEHVLVAVCSELSLVAICYMCRVHFAGLTQLLQPVCKHSQDRLMLRYQ